MEQSCRRTRDEWTGEMPPILGKISRFSYLWLRPVQVEQTLSRSLKLSVLVLFHLSIHQLVQEPLLIAQTYNHLQRLVLG